MPINMQIEFPKLEQENLKLKNNNERLCKELKDFRDKYFNKDGLLTGRQYEEITKIINENEN